MIKKILTNILLNNFKSIFYILIKSKYEFLLPDYINFVLKKNTPLGKKGENIKLFFDQIITPNVIKNGSWDIFIVNFIKKFSKKKISYSFIDVGANIGLMSRQILNVGIKINSIFCFEPEINNFLLLKKNVGFFNESFFFNYALGNTKKDKAKLYLDPLNKGNYSLSKQNVKREYRNIKIINANTIIKKIIRSNRVDNIIYKSDTQGKDIEIFLSLDADILKKIKIICIEISNFNFDKIDFLSKILEFKIIYDESGVKLNKNLLINKLEKKIEFNLLACRN
jgi:FkbM family methyltransferase